MNDKNNIDKELKELSPFLSKLKKNKKQGSLPNNYFERFEDRLMHRIQEENALTPTIKKTDLSFWDKLMLLLTPKFALGFSVAMSLVIGTIFVFNNNNISNNDNNNSFSEGHLLANLSFEETNNYIINHIDDFSIEDIVASLDIEILEKIEEKKLHKQATSSTSSTAMQRAIEAAGGKSILEDLKASDIEDELEDLF